MKNGHDVLSQHSVNWSRRELKEALKTLAYRQIWFCTDVFATYQAFVKT